MERPGRWIGLDVGAETLRACVLDQEGDVVAEQELANDPHDVGKFLDCWADRSKAMIAAESGSFVIHLTRRLRDMGHDIRVFDAWQASKFLKIRRNKTDRNDARGLAEIVRLGRNVVAEVRVRDAELQMIRSELMLRQRLVAQQSASVAAIRSVLRLNGGRLAGTQTATALRKAVTAEVGPLRTEHSIDLAAVIEPVLLICEATRLAIAKYTRRLTKAAEANGVCTRLMTVPGVGPICSLSFYCLVDDPHRFARNHDIGPYLGLTPLTKQSGKLVMRESLSRMGHALTRRYLVRSAWSFTHWDKDSDLGDWAAALHKRAGRRKTAAALARKLAIIMLAMWKSGAEFRPRLAKPPPSSGLADLVQPLGVAVARHGCGTNKEHAASLPYRFA